MSRRIDPSAPQMAPAIRPEGQNRSSRVGLAALGLFVMSIGIVGVILKNRTVSWASWSYDAALATAVGGGSLGLLGLGCEGFYRSPAGRLWADNRSSRICLAALGFLALSVGIAGIFLKRGHVSWATWSQGAAIGTAAGGGGLFVLALACQRSNRPPVYRSEIPPLYEPLAPPRGGIGAPASPSRLAVQGSPSRSGQQLFALLEDRVGNNHNQQLHYHRETARLAALTLGVTEQRLFAQPPLGVASRVEMLNRIIRNELAAVLNPVEGLLNGSVEPKAEHFQLVDTALERLREHGFTETSPGPFAETIRNLQGLTEQILTFGGVAGQPPGAAAEEIPDPRSPVWRDIFIAMPGGAALYGAIDRISQDPAEWRIGQQLLNGVYAPELAVVVRYLRDLVDAAEEQASRRPSSPSVAVEPKKPAAGAGAASSQSAPEAPPKTLLELALEEHSELAGTALADALNRLAGKRTPAEAAQDFQTIANSLDLNKVGGDWVLTDNPAVCKLLAAAAAPAKGDLAVALNAVIKCFDDADGSYYQETGAAMADLMGGGQGVRWGSDAVQADVDRYPHPLHLFRAGIWNKATLLAACATLRPSA